MATYERAHVSKLFDRLAEIAHRLIIITGPRQTGKTTLVRQALARIRRPHHYLAVDEPETATLPSFPTLAEGMALPSTRLFVPLGHERDLQWLVRHWERARIEASRSERGFVLVLDEIQKIPNWSEAVKGLWDADRRHGRQLHVVLLGSAPLRMQQGLTESLAGRFETIRLTHWSFAEMAATFDFDFRSYVYFGGYPGGAPYIHEPDRWRASILTALGGIGDDVRFPCYRNGLITRRPA